jgi:putative endonuclease
MFRRVILIHVIVIICWQFFFFPDILFSMKRSWSFYHQECECAMISADNSEPTIAETSWFVYMVSCRDRTLYTGITNDPQRRLLEHNSAGTGARYTRGRRPVSLVFLECYPSRSAALIRERSIKKMSVARKNQLIGDPAADQIPADISR